MISAAAMDEIRSRVQQLAAETRAKLRLIHKPQMSCPPAPTIYSRMSDLDLIAEGRKWATAYSNAGFCDHQRGNEVIAADREMSIIRNEIKRRGI